MAATKASKAAASNGKAAKRSNGKSVNRISKATGRKESGQELSIDIPPLDMHEIQLRLVGDRPLMVNNKMHVAAEISERYFGEGGKSGSVSKSPSSDDEKYAKAFYVMPSSKHPPGHPRGRYGVPTSGIVKCVCSAVRTTGISANSTIGTIQKSFQILEDQAGLNEVKFKKLERDVRPVNVGSNQKTVPQMRHRPMFHGWHIDLRVRYNPKIMSPSQIVNLFMHAGQFIGLCELRAEKKQGMCGGFVVKSI